MTTDPAEADPTGWQRLKSLFHQAWELNGEERAAFITSACGDDAHMRAQLERLLAASEAAGFASDSGLGSGLGGVGVGRVLE